MRPIEDCWPALSELTERATAVADRICVSIVANRKSGALVGPQDRATEYLSDAEAHQLLTGFRLAGFRTRFFDGETNFIKSVMEGEWLDSSYRQIVYNLASAGTDPGRATLIPSFCALHSIPVCNSNSYAVSFGRYKPHWQALLERFGVATPAMWIYRSGAGWLRQLMPPTDMPLIAKAAHESASIGIDDSSVGMLSHGFEAALERNSRRLQQDLIVQQLISGREIEQPVVEVEGTYYATQPLSITVEGDAALGARVLDYDTVAQDRYEFAAVEDLETIEMVSAAARAVGDILGLRGFCRVDFRIDATGQAYVIDIATAPHLVLHSSFARAFENAGWTHERMLACMIACSATKLGWL